MLYPLPDKEYVYKMIMSGFFTKEEVNNDLNLLAINYQACRDEYRQAKHRLVYVDSDDGSKIAPLFGKYHPKTDLAELERIYDQAVYVNPEYDIFYTQNTVYMPTLFDLCLKVGLRERCSIQLLPPGECVDWNTKSDPVYDDDMIIRGLWGIDINPQNQETIQLLVQDSTNGVVNELMMNNRLHFYWGKTPHHIFSNLSTPMVCLSFDNVVSMDNLL